MAFLPTARSVTRVTQASHGFVAGDVLYNNNGTWAKAQADDLATAVPVGVVESATTNDFALVTAGEIKLSGLVVATAYYLSPTVAGAFTATKPTTTGHFVVPVLRTGTATQAYVAVETPEPASVDGTVTSVAVSGNNGIGVSGSPITTSGTITLSLGAITPTSVNGNTITTGTGTLTLSTFTLTAAGNASVSGTNTGDQTISLSGDASGSGTGAITVTLATVNANVGTFGDAATAVTFTVNGKGLITAASETAILIEGATQLSDFGDPNGVATLDAGGKIPVSQLPDSVFGQLQYQGLWNANTNTPALDNTDVDKPGYYYVVSVAGTVDFGAGNVEFEVGDWVINNMTLAGAASASLWEKVDNTDAVMSVFGRLGAVTAQAGDYDADQVDFTPAGDIAATDVQAAIEELDAEKQTGPLTGDVTTVSASNPATTLAANAVTFSKFQQIAPGTLLGRSSPGTGDVEALSLASSLTLAAGTLSVTTNLALTTLALTQGTLTADAPALTVSTTWNNAGVNFNAANIAVTQTAAGSDSAFIRCERDGQERFLFRTTGTFVFYRYEAAATGAVLLARKRGTTGDITAPPVANDQLCQLTAAGWDGTAYSTAATMHIVATETFSGSTRGSQYRWYATPTGTTSLTLYAALDYTNFSLLNGTRLLITRGTLTADSPSINITETWDNVGVTFTGIKSNVTNTASAATSLIFDFQVDGVSKFSQDYTGRMYIQRQVADNAPIIVELRKRGNGSGINNAPASGDNVARLDYRGWDGTSTYLAGANVQMQAAEAWSSSASGGRLLFGVTPTGTISGVSYGQLDNVSSDPRFSLINGCRLVVTRGTITANTPSIDGTVTWNNGAVTFTGWQFALTDTASNAESNLINMTVGGTTAFSVRKDGAITSGVTRAAGLNGAYFQHNSSDTASIPHGLTVVHATSATPLANFGVIVRSRLTDSSGTVQTASSLITYWTDPTTGTRTSELQIQTITSAVSGIACYFSNNQIHLPGGTVSIPGIAHHSNPDTGFYFPSTTTMGFTIEAAQYWSLSATAMTLTTAALNINRGVLTANAPTISTTETWNNGAVAFAMWFANVTNSASSTASLLIDLQVGSVTRFAVSRSGSVLIHRQESDTSGSTLQLSKRGTTGDATAAVAAGDTIASLDALAWDGTSSSTTASIRLFALENYTNSAHGCRYLINIPSVGGTAVTTRVDLRATQLALLNGCSFVCTLGTITAVQPVFDSTVTWNSGATTFTGIKLNVTNTASATASLLLDLQVGGTSRFTAGVNGQLVSLQTFSDTSGTVQGVASTMNVIPAAGSANFYARRINYTVNASGAQSGQVSGIFISATETAMNGIAHKLIDARGATAAFSIDGAGVITTGSNSARPTGLVHGIWITGSTAPSANPATGIALWSDSGEFAYRTATASEGAGQTNRVHNRASQVTGSGTNYSLTNTTARVDFGTTDAEVSLPTAGTYLVIACVSFIGDAAGAGDDLRAKLRNSTDAADVGAEKPTTMPTNSGRSIIILDEVVTVTASKTIQIFAHNATSARGTVESTTTTIKYVRLY